MFSLWAPKVNVFLMNVFMTLRKYHYVNCFCFLCCGVPKKLKAQSRSVVWQLHGDKNAAPRNIYYQLLGCKSMFPQVIKTSYHIMSYGWYDWDPDPTCIAVSDKEKGFASITHFMVKDAVFWGEVHWRHFFFFGCSFIHKLPKTHFTFVGSCNVALWAEVWDIYLLFDEWRICLDCEHHQTVSLLFHAAC